MFMFFDSERGNVFREKARTRVRGRNVRLLAETLEGRSLMSGTGGPLANLAAVSLIAPTSTAPSVLAGSPVEGRVEAFVSASLPSVSAGVQASGIANLTWKLVAFPGKASQIAIGANGTYWVIAADKVDGFNNSIYRWSPTARAWQKMPGLATEIAVDPKGNAWIINASGQIYQWNGTGWTRRPGSAGQIAIGANGSVWILADSHTLESWTNGRWQKFALPSSLSGGAFALTVDAKGNRWVADFYNSIFRADVQHGTWTRFGTSGAYDLAINGNGALWKLQGSANGGYAVYYWSASGWVQTNGGAEQIAVDPSNHA
jgi:hypothetical protein